MKSFKDNFIEEAKIPQNILQTIRSIGEYKGKQDLFKMQSPQLLERLRKSAIIQSADSSNRIEGITAPIKRIKEIVEKKTTPANRSEQEIAGYRDVLNTIHSSYEHIKITPNIVLQFHRDMLKFAPEKGGHWKPVDNEIIEKDEKGNEKVRFNAVPAFKTPDYMKELNESFNSKLKSGDTEPLLLIPSYVLDFLCIHPFRDGNGRISRLLTTLLLYKSGYEVCRFISLEGIIEASKDTYYDSLYKSSQNWHEGKHDLLPWWEYFLGVLLNAYREFENRVGTIANKKGAKSSLIKTTIENMEGDFSVSDLQRLCPGAGIDLIRKILKSEKSKGTVKPLGRGKQAKWRKGK